MLLLLAHIAVIFKVFDSGMCMRPPGCCLPVLADKPTMPLSITSCPRRPPSYQEPLFAKSDMLDIPLRGEGEGQSCNLALNNISRSNR